MPIYKEVNKLFFKTWSSEMAYVLGFFAADGYITVNKRGGQFWSIQITDENLLKKIRFTIGSNHKIGERSPRKVTEKTQYRLQIGSIEMCNDLRRLGYDGNKTKSMSVPFVPNKFLADFARGYFDGDGNVWIGYSYKNGEKMCRTIRVSFTSCSKIFLNGLRERLTELKIGKGNLFFKKPNAYRLSYSVNDSIKLYKVMYFCYPVNDLFLLRKKKVFEKYLKCGRSSAVRIIPCHGIDRGFESHRPRNSE